MFEGFGPEKMIFLMLVLLLVFGAKRIPEIGSSLGKGIREFKKSMNDLGSEEPPSPSAQLHDSRYPAIAAAEQTDKPEVH